VYALLRERMADEYDIPTTDDVIDAVLEIARAFHVAALRQAKRDALAAAVQRVEAMPVYLVDVRRDAFDQPQHRQTVGLTEVIAAIKGTDDGE